MQRRVKRNKGLSKPSLPQKQLSSSDSRTLGRFADLISETEISDEKAFRTAVRQALTAQDRRGVAKLVDGIQRGDVTENMLRAHWNTMAIADTFYMVSPLTHFALTMAQAINEEP